MLNSHNQNYYHDNIMPTDHDPLMPRKEAATYINSTVGTMAVWDCTKKYDLKPVRRGNRAYYYKSVLDEFKLRHMRP